MKHKILHGTERQANELVELHARKHFFQRHLIRGKADNDPDLIQACRNAIESLQREINEYELEITQTKENQHGTKKETRTRIDSRS